MEYMSPGGVPQAWVRAPLYTDTTRTPGAARFGGAQSQTHPLPFTRSKHTHTHTCTHSALACTRAAAELYLSAFTDLEHKCLNHTLATR